MNIFHVNIFDVYHNDQKEQIMDRKMRHSGVYESKCSYEEFIYNLKNLIMNEKNDGLIIDINSIENLFFIDIELLLPVDNIYENYNINYINNYLNDNYNKTDKGKLDIENNIDGIVFLSFEDFGDNTLDYVRDILKENNLTNYTISINTNIYEWGASSFFEEFKISFIVDISIDILKKIISIIKNEDINGKIDINENIKRQAADILGYTIDNYDIVSLNKTDSGGYKIKFLNLYKELNTISDKNLNIISLDIIDI